MRRLSGYKSERALCASGRVAGVLESISCGTDHHVNSTPLAPQSAPSYACEATRVLSPQVWGRTSALSCGHIPREKDLHAGKKRIVLAAEELFNLCSVSSPAPTNPSVAVCHRPPLFRTRACKRFAGWQGIWEKRGKYARCGVEGVQTSRELRRGALVFEHVCGPLLKIASGFREFDLGEFLERRGVTCKHSVKGARAQARME